MGEVEARIDVADHHGRAAARDRVGLGRVNLDHVPLQARQGVCVGCWEIHSRAVRRFARDLVA